MFSIYDNALQYLNSTSEEKTIICNDSLSALESLSSFDHSNKTFNSLSPTLRFSAYFCWVLGYVGIPGNKLAD